MTQQTQTTLYHQAIRFPAGYEILFGQYRSELTYHARQEAESDKYGHINIPADFTINQTNLVEIEVDNIGHILKVVVRLDYSNKFCLCLAVIPHADNTATVKTCWLNCRNDNHKTLDKKKYSD